MEVLVAVATFNEMQLVLQFNIYYEVLVETDGKFKSHFFNGENALKVRELAISCFMELLLTKECSQNEMQVFMFLRYLPNGERIELLSTSSYCKPEINLSSLQAEYVLYRQQGLAAYLAIYNKANPNQIRIVWPTFKNTHCTKGQKNQILLAHHYWIFLGKKQEVVDR